MPNRASALEPRPERPEKSEQAEAPSSQNIHGSTHVHVAFPFSKINVQDPTDELRELSALVADLISALEATTGGSLKELRQRSQELADRLS